MARRRLTTSLDVYMNARLVGKLTRARSGAVDFRYAAAWLEWDHAFAISLALPLREERYVGDPVIAVFDNLLPDNEQTRRRVAERMRADGTDAFSLLAAVGRDCVGALQLLPEGVEPTSPGEVVGNVLSTAEVASLLRNLEVAPLGLDPERDFRISLAGAQEKTALLYHDGAWKLPSGTTATTHILKPQMGRRGEHDLSRSVENEYLCARILSELGLPTAGTDIVDFQDQRALVVERFDRRWTTDGRLLRLPQEDFCQALGVPPALRYQVDGGPGILDVLGLLNGADDPLRDRMSFLKTQMVYWLLGATDGHAKNFSLLLNPGSGFHLAPLYDVMSVQPLQDAGTLRHRDMKMAMAVGDRGHYRVEEIMPRHFEQTAAAARLPKRAVEHTAAELADELPTALDDVAGSLPGRFPEELVASIAAGTRNRMNRLAHTP